jgi:hypothetical protein
VQIWGKKFFRATLGGHFLQLFLAESDRLFHEKYLGLFPGGSKQFRITVIVERCFVLPVAIGDENIFLVIVLPKFKVPAAGKIPDQFFASVEDFEELPVLVGLEGHPYSSYEHVFFIGLQFQN